MIRTPAILLKIARRETRNFPIPVAEAPSRIKTAEKPKTKKRALKKILAFRAEGLVSCCISSADTPETKERYPGIRGSTQGERNETTPAKKATPSEIWLSSVIVFVPGHFYRF